MSEKKSEFNYTPVEHTSYSTLSRSRSQPRPGTDLIMGVRPCWYRRICRLRLRRLNLREGGREGGRERVGEGGEGEGEERGGRREERERGGGREGGREGWGEGEREGEDVFTCK